MNAPSRLIVAATMAVLLLAGMSASPFAVGQGPDATPVAISYPAYLQGGTCDRPGDPVAALAFTATGDADPGSDGIADETPVATGAEGLPAAVSVTEVDASLDELLADQLIVRVVESEARPDIDIACGRIGGQPDTDGNLYLTIPERDDSGVTGIVWLQADGDATTVTLFLIPASPVPNATPAA